VSRVAIYTDVHGAGFRALAYKWPLPEEYGHTRKEAVEKLMPMVLEEARRLRAQGRPLPAADDALPPGTRGELEFFAV